MSQDTPTPIALVQPGKSCRRFSMCAQCRSDKQKCEPLGRPWDDLQKQKCDRCLKLKHDCGPPIESKGRGRQRKGQLHQPTPATFHAQVSTALDEMVLSTSMGSFSSIGSPFVSSEMTPRTASLSSFLQFPTTSLNSSATAGIVDPLGDRFDQRKAPFSKRKYSEESGRSSLKHLEDILGSWRMLQLDEIFLLTRQQQIGDSAASKMAHRRTMKLLEAVNTEIKDRLGDIVSTATEHMGESKEAFFRRLEVFFYKLDRGNSNVWNAVAENSSTTNEIQRIRASIKAVSHRYLQRKGHFSHAEFVTDGMAMRPDASNPPRLGSEVEAKATFQKAAYDIGQILESLDLEEDPHEDSCSGSASSPPDSKTSRAYPAAQLAYRAGRKDLACRWWRDGFASPLEVDLLQMNAVHHAVRNGDMGSLRELKKHTPTIFSHPGTDILGHSPLAVAAIEGDLDIFKYLYWHGAPTWGRDQDNRSILALAARAGKKNIVGYMLSKCLFSPLLGEAVNQAIEGRHESLASEMIRILSPSLTLCDSDVLQAMSDKASHWDMSQVVLEIRKVQGSISVPVNQLLAIPSLDSLEYHRMEGTRRDDNETLYDEQSSTSHMVSLDGVDYISVSVRDIGGHSEYPNSYPAFDAYSY